MAILCVQNICKEAVVWLKLLDDRLTQAVFSVLIDAPSCIPRASHDLQILQASQALSPWIH